MNTKAEVGMEREYFGGLARLIRCASQTDERGALLPLPFDQMPFVPCRSFAITDVPAGVVRGGHAHRSGQQLLFCLQGRMEAILRYQGQEAMIPLAPASFGLVYGPGVWCQQRYVVEGSVLLVFASEPYDPDSYIYEAEPVVRTPPP